MSIKLSADEMKYMALFEAITGVPSKDCVILNSNDRIIFVVNHGKVGLAIGRNGKNVRHLRKIFKKNIDVVEYASTPEKLIKNCLHPSSSVEVKIIKRNGSKIALVTVKPEERGIAIGKNGRNVIRARVLAKRYFGIDEVIIK